MTAVISMRKEMKNFGVSIISMVWQSFFKPSSTGIMRLYMFPRHSVSFFEFSLDPTVSL